MDGGRDDGLIGFPPGLVEQAVTDPSELGDLEQRLATAGRVVVVVGSSISGLVLAARLGRVEGLRVVLVAGAPPVRRRLVAGCSLRRATRPRRGPGPPGRHPRP